MAAKKLIGTLACPSCGHKQKARIPENGCQHFYKCDGCKKLISSKDQCVFCAYGDRKCPSGC